MADEELERPGRVMGVGCGCTLEPVSGVRKYCERHRPKATAKGQAMEAMDRAWRLLKVGSVPTILDVVQVRGYLEFAMERVGAIEELKKARGVRK